MKKLNACEIYGESDWNNFTASKSKSEANAKSLLCFMP